MPFQSVTAPILAKSRTPKIKKLYEEIGGSPITKLTTIQGEKTVELLDKLSPETAPHIPYIGFRYAGPTIPDALDKMKSDGIKRVIAFSQYPQFSCTTSGSSFNHLWRNIKAKNLENEFSWSIIDRWPSHPKFIDAVSKTINDALVNFSDETRDDVIILFSAHSLPLKTVFKGDQYTAEVAATVFHVMKNLNFSHKYMLTWQSQVGRIPWLEPQTDKVLEDLGKSQASVLIVPIAFTTDHIETLSEIDIEFKAVADKSGIKEYYRAKALNDDPLAIEALASIIHDHIKSNQRHSLQYSFNCPSCENPLCRTILNPAEGTSVKPLEPY